MCVVGLDRYLPALPRPCIDTHRLQCDGQKPGGHLLAGSDDRIIFARVIERQIAAADLWHLLRPANQLIGLAGHGRDHNGDLIAGIHLAFDVARDIADSVQIGDRSPAEFHHDARHRFEMPSKRSRKEPGR